MEALPTGGVGGLAPPQYRYCTNIVDILPIYIDVVPIQLVLCQYWGLAEVMLILLHNSWCFTNIMRILYQYYEVISTEEKTSIQTLYYRGPIPSHPNPLIGLSIQKHSILIVDLKQPKADQADQCRPRQTKVDQSRPRQTKADQCTMGLLKNGVKSGQL